MIVELPLILTGGLLGSSHCVGMCGGFALLIGMDSQNWKRNFWYQMLYSFGRLFTYMVMGAFGGFLGGRLSDQFSTMVNVPAAMSLIAGLFLVYQGLAAAGIKLFGKQKQQTSGGACLAGSAFASFLRSPHWASKFLAGMLTGLLPCGLVYAFLSLAAASGDLFIGMLIMGTFGLGTFPLMITTGIAGSFMSLMARQRMLKVAAWCVVLTGFLTIARGFGFVTLPGETEPPSCPFCAQNDEVPNATTLPGD